MCFYCINFDSPKFNTRDYSFDKSIYHQLTTSELKTGLSLKLIGYCKNQFPIRVTG